MTEFTSMPLTIHLTSFPMLERELGNVDKCIDRILELIVFTPKGSYSADPEFGFEYWNHEFYNLNVREFNNNYMSIMTDTKSVNGISRKQCETSLRNSILAYEPRLQHPEVKVELDINSKPANMNMQSKYEMRIIITGEIDDGLGVSRAYEKRIAFMVEPIAHKIIL